MAFCWRADDGSTLNADFGSFVVFKRFRNSIDKELYSFVIFQGGGEVLTPADHPLDPRMQLVVSMQHNQIFSRRAVMSDLQHRQNNKHLFSRIQVTCEYDQERLDLYLTY